MHYFQAYYRQNDNTLYLLNYRVSIVALHNDSNIWQYVNPSDRVAQIVIIKYFAPSLLEVSELSSTERNDGGFGHSGTK